MGLEIIYLDSSKHCNELISIEHIHIACPNRVLPWLHSHVSPIGDTGIKLLQAAHRVPTMVDKHLVLGVGGVAGIHDETRKVANAVDPERVAMEVSRGSCELDKSSSFMLVTIQDNLLHGFEVVIVLNQSGEQLVDHAALHTMSLASLGALLKLLNASLDQVDVALPLQLCSCSVEELDGAGGMINDLLPFGSHRPDLHMRPFLCPVCGGRDSELLLTTLGNEGLCNRDVADVKAAALPFGVVLLHQKLTKSLGNVCIQRLMGS